MRPMVCFFTTYIINNFIVDILFFLNSFLSWAQSDSNTTCRGGSKGGGVIKKKGAANEWCWENETKKMEFETNHIILLMNSPIPSPCASITLCSLLLSPLTPTLLSTLPLHPVPHSLYSFFRGWIVCNIFRSERGEFGTALTHSRGSYIASIWSSAYHQPRSVT